LGTQRIGNSLRWKPLPSNGAENVTWTVCRHVCNSELYSVVTLYLNCAIHLVINPTHVYPSTVTLPLENIFGGEGLRISGPVLYSAFSPVAMYE
jgi:hypothetical protein